MRKGTNNHLDIYAPKNDKEALDKAVAEVCEKLKGVRQKYRATFYYMLAKNLKRESHLR
jgi:deoxyhypusine synthase